MSIAAASFENLALVYVIPWVQTIDETRRQRLEMLIREHNNSIAELNAAMGMDRTDATFSQIRNQAVHSKTGKPRSMGDDLARRLEATLKKPVGWMDTPPTYAELHGENDPRAKVMAMMESMPEDQWPVAARLLDALAKPAKENGTTG
jgi:hypothetical protein